MGKDKFDIELPQSIIESYARHLAVEIRKYYANADAREVQERASGKGIDYRVPSDEQNT